DVFAIKEKLLHWKSRIGAEAARVPDVVGSSSSKSADVSRSKADTARPSEAEWIRTLALVLPTERRTEVLRQLVTALAQIAAQGLGMESADPDDLAPAYISERLGHSRSRNYAAELIS